MTKINLLPWRQELLKKNQKEFINTRPLRDGPLLAQQ